MAKVTEYIRIKLEQRLRRGLLGTKLGSVPFNVIRSLVESSWQEDVQQHLVEQTILADATTVSYPLTDDLPGYFRREKAFENRLLFTLRNVRAGAHSGVVWLPNNRILMESFGSLQRLLGWGREVQRDLMYPGNLLKVSTPAILCPDTGYYHFILEVAPSVVTALQHNPEASIIIHPDSGRYVRDVVGMIREKFPAAGIVEHAGQVSLETLLLVQYTAYSGFVHPYDLGTLRNLLLEEKAEKSGGEPSRRLYISRRNSPKRSLANEAELEKELSRRSFEIFTSEKHSLCEQLSRFQDADVIVAPHGAGLANMIVARPGTRIIEIFPSYTFNDCYARLAVQSGFSYQYDKCSRGDNREEVIPVQAICAKVDALVPMGR